MDFTSLSFLSCYVLQSLQCTDNYDKYWPVHKESHMYWLSKKISRELLSLTYVLCRGEGSRIFRISIWNLSNDKFKILYSVSLYFSFLLLDNNSNHSSGLKWQARSYRFWLCGLTGLSWMAFLPQVMRGMNWVRRSKMALHMVCSWCWVLCK